MVITTTEKDYLEQDPHIRGQTYACLSFLSPEDVIKQKDAFYFERYLQKFSARMHELADGIEKLHPDATDTIRAIKEQYSEIFDSATLTEDFKFFTSNNGDTLQKDFNEQYDFQTNIRGIKVRGVYESVQEAQNRCEQLKKIDGDKFNIYISEVGCWCPWAPNPNDIKNQEYAVDSLNTMMHEYEKNNDSRNEQYLERKRDLQSRMARQDDIDSLSEMREALEDADPKTKQMQEQDA